MSHSGSVLAVLGEVNVDRILDYRGGKMPHLLGTSPEGILSDAPNILFGKHRMRMARNSNRDWLTEMKEVLSEWWEEELYCLSSVAARQKLVSIFGHPDVGCKPLARALESNGEDLVSAVRQLEQCRSPSRNASPQRTANLQQSTAPNFISAWSLHTESAAPAPPNSPVPPRQGLTNYKLCSQEG